MPIPSPPLRLRLCRTRNLVRVPVRVVALLTPHALVRAFRRPSDRPFGRLHALLCTVLHSLALVRLLALLYNPLLA